MHLCLKFNTSENKIHSKKYQKVKFHFSLFKYVYWGSNDAENMVSRKSLNHYIIKRNYVCIILCVYTYAHMFM